ncbi:hypothetical protein GLOTRDRAFT_131527 [Gloeophyllum trabeum ATCC 11539]|uniref:Uncharacterized protein n=1 Tax=Gloeophyllum trabeum (strain ATCC 11539 / FP-39264 / Madison 617) TaxID=670483 RepID=S7Q0K0_GLOTA|nr:uncharacterized protein GLOTRDRAFT_131527 [Gloeophyllum trabeum ATCC 11539]EPQ53253.1 hypothetical protein GLOTRDRAFT_131527 [Gloeophyllum trabeum ATCC 11539]
MSFPPEAAVQLKVDDLSDEVPPQALEAMLAVIKKISDPQPLRTLLITSALNYRHALEFKGWTSVLPNESGSHPPAAKIRLTAMNSGPEAEPVVQKMERCLPLSDVKYLPIEDVPSFDAWKKSFGHMREVTKLPRLLTGKRKTPGKQNADSRDVEDDDPHVHLFPHPKHLHLDGVVRTLTWDEDVNIEDIEEDGDEYSDNSDYA